MVTAHATSYNPDFKMDFPGDCLSLFTTTSLPSVFRRTTLSSVSNPTDCWGREEGKLTRASATVISNPAEKFSLLESKKH